MADLGASRDQVGDYLQERLQEDQQWVKIQQRVNISI